MMGIANSNLTVIVREGGHSLNRPTPGLPYRLWKVLIKSAPIQNSVNYNEEGTDGYTCLPDVQRGS